jgi:DNA-binding transcriptional LysR family regulator
MSQAPRAHFKELTLVQLKSFAVVCRTHSYAAAARELLLTTPAVWEQMQGLERHYGRPLLIRRGNGILPTLDGQQLLDMITPLLAGLDSTREILQHRSGALPSVITVATNLRVLAEEISRGLARFQSDYPAIRLRLFFTGNDVDERVARGEADVGFTLQPGPDIPCSPAVVYEPAGEVDYLLVAPARHPLTKSRSLQLGHIAEYPLVVGEEGAYSRRRVQEVLHRHNLTQNIRVVVETSSDEYTLSCVRSGLGIGITIGTGKGPLYQGLAARPLRRWFGTARLGFLWKRGAYESNLQRQLATMIKRIVLEGAKKETRRGVVGVKPMATASPPVAKS